MTDKERYATAGTWESVFREEGNPVNESTIRYRLDKAGVNGETARDKIGRVLYESFYSESTVRELCADLLEILPEADENGLIRQDGKIYGSVMGLARLLGISDGTIRAAMQQRSLDSIRGKEKTGGVYNYYAESDLRALCADLLEQLPRADENGLIEQNGETYCTTKRLIRLLGISRAAIISRIRKSSIKPLRSKLRGGQVCNFYAESDVRVLCADLLEILPEADENGLIEQDGNTYGTVHSLSNMFGISMRPISSRIKKYFPKFIQGKDKTGSVYKFYAASDVRALCGDLLEELPQADEDGFIEIEGRIYGTFISLARRLDVCMATIRLRVKKNSVQSVRARSSMGCVYDFYLLSDVCELCADLIAKKSNDR